MRKLIIGGVVLLSVVGGLVYFSTQRKKRDEEVASFSDSISKLLGKEATQSNFYGTENVGVSGSKKLTSTQAAEFATKIHDAWGVFNDDEDAIKEVFRACVSVEQVHQVAAAYEAKYKIALLTDLLNGLSDSERAEMDEIMKIKPRYKL